MPAAAIGLLAAILNGPAMSDETSYGLLDPKPDGKLREFNPDRPGQSHDPTTINGGHAAVEIGGFEHVFDPRGPSATTTRNYIYANTNLRLGLTDSVEFQVGAPLSNLYRMSGDEVARGKGIGDTTLGIKANLLGNDGGEHQLAILPTIKLPTSAAMIGNGFVEANFALPYNYNFTRDLALTLEPSVALLRNTPNTRYRDGLGFIAGLDQRIGRVVIASVEVAVQASTERKQATTWSVSPSLAYFLTKNLQLDVGVTLGLNKATPRYDPSLGVSARF